MSAIPQQVLDRQKASINTFVAAQSAVFAGFEKLVELNLKVVRATLDEVAQKSQQAAEVKDPQEAAAFASGLLQPGAEKALAYTKHVYDIVAGANAEAGSQGSAGNATGRAADRQQLRNSGTERGPRGRGRARSA